MNFAGALPKRKNPVSYEATVSDRYVAEETTHISANTRHDGSL
jgi:hypothetical protein